MTPITISETEGPPSDCDHRAHLPAFEAEACTYLSAEQVRERWPLFEGKCQMCGRQVRIWHSIEHMKAGVWV